VIAEFLVNLSLGPEMQNLSLGVWSPGLGLETWSLGLVDPSLDYIIETGYIVPQEYEIYCVGPGDKIHTS